MTHPSTSSDTHELLRRCLAHIAEPAGFTRDIVADPARFKALCDAIDARRQALIDDLRAALQEAEREL